MQPSPEGQLHQARKFLELCGEFGEVMDSIHEGLEIYRTKREGATLEEFEQLNEVFTTALPAMREILDTFHKEYVKTVTMLGGTVTYE